MRKAAKAAMTRRRKNTHEEIREAVELARLLTAPIEPEYPQRIVQSSGTGLPEVEKADMMRKARKNTPEEIRKAVELTRLLTAPIEPEYPQRIVQSSGTSLK